MAARCVDRDGLEPGIGGGTQAQSSEHARKLCAAWPHAAHGKSCESMDVLERCSTVSHMVLSLPPGPSPVVFSVRPRERPAGEDTGSADERGQRWPRWAMPIRDRGPVGVVRHRDAPGWVCARRGRP